MLSLYIFVVFEVCFVVEGDMKDEIERGCRCVDDDDDNLDTILKMEEE